MDLSDWLLETPVVFVLTNLYGQFQHKNMISIDKIKLNLKITQNDNEVENNIKLKFVNY